jgi:spoIIIJ-associated protein
MEKGLANMEMSDKQAQIFDASKKVLEDLLKLMDLSSIVTMSEEFTVLGEDGETTSIGLNIEGDELGILIGRRGQTMVSLQHILRLIMSHKMDVKVPIVIDVEGYKQRRCDGLRSLAKKLADQVRLRKIPFTMEPMPAFERRVIHMALADNQGVTTESTGEGEERKVVILPKDKRRQM